MSQPNPSHHVHKAKQILLNHHGRPTDSSQDRNYHFKKPTETSIPVGNYLGEFEFVAAEPKNYTYNTFQGKQTCKVRGFTLNERGQKILNFKSMKDLVLNEILQPEDDQCTLTLQNPHKITRYAAKKKPSKQYRKTKSTKSFLTNVSSTVTPFNHFPTAINASPHLDFQPQHHE